MKARQRFRMLLLGSVLIFFLASINSNAQSFVFEMPVNPDEAYLIQKYDVYNSTAQGYHTGIDLYTKGGKPTIYPTAPGVVVIMQPNGPCSDYHGEGGGCKDHGLGNTVIIEHIVENGQPIYSLYAHLDSINLSLHEGSIVGHSDPIGIMGASGYGLSDYWKNSDGTSAIHLHFEIKDEAVLSNPKGEGIHFGYMPSSADNYGYHNPYTFLNRVEVVRTDEAKPLPNGVIFENLSIALYSKERPRGTGDGWTSIALQFILRKIKPAGTSPIISFELIDDHGNVYDDPFYYGPSYEYEIGPNVGLYEATRSGENKSGIMIAQAPVGLTWVVSWNPIKIPLVAPDSISFLKMYYRYNPVHWAEKTELATMEFPNLKVVRITNFQSELEEQNCISLPYKLWEGEYISATMHKIRKAKDYLVIPVTVKNDDYTPSGFFLGSVGIQDSNGKIWWGPPNLSRDTLPSLTVGVSVPGLSEKTIEMRFPADTKVILFASELGYYRNYGSTKATYFSQPFKEGSQNFLVLLRVVPENFDVPREPTPQ